MLRGRRNREDYLIEILIILEGFLDFCSQAKELLFQMHEQCYLSGRKLQHLSQTVDRLTTHLEALKGRLQECNERKN